MQTIGRQNEFRSVDANSLICERSKQKFFGTAVRRIVTSTSKILGGEFEFATQLPLNTTLKK